MILLVVAKAPVPGLAKTRLARTLGAANGPGLAADLAAAALLDTLDAVGEAAARLGGRPPVVALTGSLDAAARSREVSAALRACTVIPQRGVDFAARLAAAHVDAAAQAGSAGGTGPVLQIGTDTPQAGPERLVRAAEHLTRAAAVLGPATDGGWWLLGLRDPSRANALEQVPMSTDRTGELTRRALERAGLTVAPVGELRDVDTADDARVVAAEAPGTRFAAAYRALGVFA